MMAVKRGARSSVGIGIPTLLTILVVVLLTTFAVLSLVSAKADYTLSVKAAQANQAYYAADGQATAWLSQVEAKAMAAVKAGRDVKGALEEAGYAVKGGGAAAAGKSGKSSDLELSGSWPVAGGSAGNLEVQVSISSTDGSATVKRWQVVTNAEAK
jgi:hypothetical protein